jgi:hypothetical protein
MSTPEYLAADVRAWEGAVPRGYKRLADTGTTEDVVDTALTVGEMGTLLVGAAAVRLSFGASVATTDPIIPAYGRFDWRVTDGTDTPRIEAADGSSAYEAWVWTSSGD